MDQLICQHCNILYIYSRKERTTKTHCSTCHSLSRRVLVKTKIVEIMGGKCSICDYDDCVGALDLHHIDPSKKEFSFSGNYCLSWKSLREEVKKCVLLCANCHKMYHHNCEDNFCKHNNIINVQLQEYNIPEKSPISEYEIDGRSKDPMYKRIYGTKQEYVKQRKLENLEANKNKVKQVLESGIDFNKFGWKTKVSKIIGITPQRTKQWMERNIPLYKEINKDVI